MFFFNDTATTEIYTLSLHDALPISSGRRSRRPPRDCLDDDRAEGVSLLGDRLATPHELERREERYGSLGPRPTARQDRKSTRLNSSHANISYAVFCLKKKKNN